MEINKIELSKKLTKIANEIDKERDEVSIEKYSCDNPGNDAYLRYLNLKEAHLQELSNNLWDAIMALEWFTSE